MNCSDFYSRIESGKEGRDLEFKSTGSLSDHNFRYKIVRAILAMSNIRDGGDIIIGISSRGDLDGMYQDDYDSFNEEELKDKVNLYADPPTDFTLEKLDCNNRKFIVIRVSEFEEVPVICKKPERQILEEGALYIRTRHRRPESKKIPDSIHMRELLDLATDKMFLSEKGKMKRRRYIRTNILQKVLSFCFPKK